MEKYDLSPDSELVRWLDRCLSMTVESFYVVDVQKDSFCYIQPNNLFLCGYSVEEAKDMGDKFYSNIVLPEDLSLWTSMRKLMMQYILYFEEKWEEIDCFSCTFRLQRLYAFHPHPLPNMVYHLTKPVWEDDKLRYLICSIRSSTAKEAGNLRMHNKDGSTCEEYNFKSRKWKRKTIESLTERERAILILAQQGKSSVEIADMLFKAYNTIRNQIKALFEKLGVHSIQEAIDVANNSHLLYMQKQEAKPLPVKRTRVLITDVMMQQIQHDLDSGLSNRKTADKFGIAESAIRYWKKKGKLK